MLQLGPYGRDMEIRTEKEESLSEEVWRGQMIYTYRFTQTNIGNMMSVKDERISIQIYRSNFY